MCSYFMISGSVSFQDTTVTLTCPIVDDNSNFQWKKEKESIKDEHQVTLSLPKYTNKNDGLYSCTGSENLEEKTHYFYIKAKGKCKSKIHEDIFFFFRKQHNGNSICFFCVLSCKNNVNYNRCNFQILSNHWC